MLSEETTIAVTSPFRGGLRLGLKKCIVFFKSFRKRLEQIQHGVLYFFFSLKVSFDRREFNGWYSFFW